MSGETDLLQMIVQRLNESLASKFISAEVRQSLELILASVRKDIDSQSESTKYAVSA
jgi:hypothetical protein